MSDTSVLTACCKVNLYLRILGKREDGYHDLESLFYPLEQPQDKLFIDLMPRGNGFTLTCSQPALRQDNILYKTYKLFGDNSGFYPDLHVHLQKGIPAGAGLGGGSSDAAALLLYLYKLARENSIAMQYPLDELAAGLGADVSFFLQGQKPAWVSGYGNVVQAVETDLEGSILLLICPQVQISSAQAYKWWDKYIQEQANTRGNLFLTSNENMFTKYFLSRGQIWHNDFEKVILPEYPELRNLKVQLLSCGAVSTVLSGSGSSVVSAFRSEKAINTACFFLGKTNYKYYINYL